MDNQNSYQDLNQYWNEIILFTKEVFSVYLSRITGEGPEHSTNQQLFQDTLLRKEVMNFLSGTEANADNVVELEERVIAKAQCSMQEGLFLPLEYLCRIFVLNRFERFVITVLAASSMDTGFEKVYSFIHNDLRRNSLSPDLALELYCGPDYTREVMTAAFCGNSNLNRFFLSYDAGNNVGYRMKHLFRLKTEIEDFLHGELDLSGSVGRFTQSYPPGDPLPALLLKDKPYEHMLKFLSGIKKNTSVLLYLYGERGIGKKLNIRHLAASRDKSVVFLDLEKLEAYLDSTGSVSDLYPLLQSLIINVILRQSFLCISSNSYDLEEKDKTFQLLGVILEYIGEDLPVIFLTSDCPKKLKLPTEKFDILAIEAAAGSMEENHIFWTSMAKDYHFDSDVKLESFADKFVLTPGRIREILEEAQKLSMWYGKEAISLKLLLKVCFEKIEHNLGKKAQKVKMVYQWEDLILPDYQKNILKAACDQITYKYKVFSEWGFDEKMAYGTGLSLIFSGSPGTGKTMAAQIIARELGLELYKIELACVVSKYIGETERNLNEIFEEAKKSQAIIFFDEADVLFSKRSEVKDSNDKYSNMEAAFMLQKIEEYTGIVILATNYQQNIDEAFKRRIKFLIDFPFPDQDYRKRIWLRVFPDRLPLGKDIDYDFLAEHYELSGSNIKNVALNAAFLAASNNSSVGMEYIIRAIINEFTKSGKKLSREDLGEYFMYI